MCVILMGKIYCSECGAEMDDSSLFCTECGSKIDNVSNNDIIGNLNQNLISNGNIDVNDIIRRFKSPLLIKGMIAIAIIEAIAFSFTWMGISFSLRIIPMLFNIIAVLAVFICPLLIGYLSKESILFLSFYTFVMAIVVLIVHFIFAPFGFMSIFSFLFMLFVMELMALIGKFAQIHLNI